ncbi:unnamed protein product [Cylicocyclus nassatus]|uniref:SAM domain-containing protein n=1 Tax=Cylicocyclus nassatus TaxID=53992 RepID=A0AA36DMX2_CYLNA|nr:unnamed protein product [Cylicocyclus nassatus]
MLESDAKALIYCADIFRNTVSYVTVQGSCKSDSSFLPYNYSNFKLKVIEFRNSQNLCWFCCHEYLKQDFDEDIVQKIDAAVSVFDKPQIPLFFQENLLKLPLLSNSSNTHRPLLPVDKDFCCFRGSDSLSDMSRKNPLRSALLGTHYLMQTWSSFYDEPVMQPGSSTVACFANLRSSFNAATSLPPNVPLNSGQCRLPSDGFYGKRTESQFYPQMDTQNQQHRLRPDATSSIVSCSPPLTPPALELLKPGMKDVPAWLKSLRLHKYTSLFTELSYDEMMRLDEVELERRNVTKGARTKILQSIQKLYSRSADLRAMHERLAPSHPQRCLRCAIATLRQMIATPMVPYTPLPGESSDSVDGFLNITYINDQNVPGLIFNVLRDVQQAVFVCGRQPVNLEYEYLLMLFTIFDRLCSNEAFTSAQKQRVHQWKRLARKAIRPADVRRQRVGLPHSGKCELCHYKDLSQRENGKANNKQVVASSQFHHNAQHRPADVMVNQYSTPRDWSQVMRNAQIMASLPSPQLATDQLNARHWPPSYSMEAACNGNAHLKNRLRQMLPLNAQMITQSLPQYRSQQHLISVDQSIPLLSGSSQSHEGPSRWPRSIYENHELLGSGTAGRVQLTQPMSLWDALSSTCPLVEKGGEMTSGYCSSTSERSSGAGSPRACGQTLYDRVCREVTALQLSI